MTVTLAITLVGVLLHPGFAVAGVQKVLASGDGLHLCERDPTLWRGHDRSEVPFFLDESVVLEMPLGMPQTLTPAVCTTKAAFDVTVSITVPPIFGVKTDFRWTVSRRSSRGTTFTASFGSGDVGAMFGPQGGLELKTSVLGKHTITYLIMGLTENYVWIEPIKGSFEIEAK
jgi:hypothetical protein